MKCKENTTVIGKKRFPLYMINSDFLESFTFGTSFQGDMVPITARKLWKCHLYYDKLFLACTNYFLRSRKSYNRRNLTNDGLLTWWRNFSTLGKFCQTDSHTEQVGRVWVLQETEGNKHEIQRFFGDFNLRRKCLEIWATCGTVVKENLWVMLLLYT